MSEVESSLEQAKINKAERRISFFIWLNSCVIVPGSFINSV